MTHYASQSPPFQVFLYPSQTDTVINEQLNGTTSPGSAYLVLLGVFKLNCGCPYTWKGQGTTRGGSWTNSDSVLCVIVIMVIQVWANDMDVYVLMRTLLIAQKCIEE